MNNNYMKREREKKKKLIHITYTVFDYVLSVSGRMDVGRIAYKF